MMQSFSELKSQDRACRWHWDHAIHFDVLYPPWVKTAGLGGSDVPMALG
jgi:hypothetical protein